MQRFVFVAWLVLCVGAAAGCDSDSNEQAAPPPPPSDATTRQVAIYLIRDGKVAPVRRATHPGVDAVSDTISLLLSGPTDAEQRAGYTTSVDLAGLDDISIVDGTARIEPASSAGQVSALAAAQVFHTLTQFRDVEHVVIDGNEVTAATVEDHTPQILIESPLTGDTVRSPIRLRGTANVFEATVSIEVRDETGNVILETFTTATSGTGTRGTFDTKLSLPKTTGSVTIVAFEASAEDGRPLHSTAVQVTLAR